MRPMRLPAALEPLEGPVFRGLWLAWLAANVTMGMNDIAAAWLMTSLTPSPVMVALVSTASTLPMFVLGLPSGALADIVDRRRYFAATQLWVSLNAALLALLALTGQLTAPLLLLLTFSNGVGLAMRLPVFAAIIPQVVPRAQLAPALALNSVAMNLSRVVGPMFAGVLLAGLGTAAVFVCNVVLAAAAMVLILRWRCEPQASTLPGERFVGAMRAGVVFTLQSMRLRAVLLRAFLFFLQTAALVSLLPLVARELHGGGPGTFTVMLSCMGIGAVIAAFVFPRWHARFSRDRFVDAGTLVAALLSSLIVAVPELWLALPAMVGIGVAWLSVVNSLTVSAQLVMPDWVRARGMSIYQMALMGGAAAGSVLWGQLAGLTSVRTAIRVAAALGVLALPTMRRLRIGGGTEPDYSPASTQAPAAPAIAIAPDEGPVMVTIEYQVDPQQAAAFARVMERTRAARLRQGALSWGLFRDVSVPGRCVEYFIDENWIEHQRRLARFTAFDADLRRQRLAFHRGAEPPVVRRYVAGAQGEADPAQS